MELEAKSEEVKKLRVFHIRPFSIVLKKDLKVKRKAIEESKERVKNFSIVVPKLKLSKKSVSQFLQHSEISFRFVN
jgi:hypothetical protein